VRIFLPEKGLKVPFVAVDFGKGEQHSEAYRAINPRRVVKTLALVASRDALAAEAFALATSLWQSAVAEALGVDVAKFVHEAFSSGALQVLGAVRTLAEAGVAFEALSRVDPGAAEAVVLQIESAVRFAQAERGRGALPARTCGGSKGSRGRAVGP